MTRREIEGKRQGTMAWGAARRAPGRTIHTSADYITSHGNPHGPWSSDASPLIAENSPLKPGDSVRGGTASAGFQRDPPILAETKESRRYRWMRRSQVAWEIARGAAPAMLLYTLFTGIENHG